MSDIRNRTFEQLKGKFPFSAASTQFLRPSRQLSNGNQALPTKARLQRGVCTAQRKTGFKTRARLMVGNSMRRLQYLSVGADEKFSSFSQQQRPVKVISKSSQSGLVYIRELDLRSTGGGSGPRHEARVASSYQSTSGSQQEVP